MKKCVWNVIHNNNFVLYCKKLIELLKILDEPKLLQVHTINYITCVIL